MQNARPRTNRTRGSLIYNQTVHVSYSLLLIVVCKRTMSQFQSVISHTDNNNIIITPSIPYAFYYNLA